MKKYHVSATHCIFMISLIVLVGCSTVQQASVKPAANPTDESFGAIAFSNTTQRWHIRWNVSDQSRADYLATQYCGASDCVVVLRFGPGQCGTFSLGDLGALGTGLGTTNDDAATAALSDCEKSSQSCKIAPVRCNGGS